MKFFVPVLALAPFLFSCEKDPQIKPLETPVVPVTPIDTSQLVTASGQVFFDFKAMMDGSDLVPGTKWYRNANGDSLTVNKFNYFISNIRLKKEDGTVFVEKESYHLIKHLENRTKFTLTGVPSGTYSSVQFLIGVDSLRNVSGVQKGDLDVNLDMYWDWNQGYIFFKLEGNYKTPNTGGATPYGMHVGNYSCIETRTITLPTKLLVKEKKEAGIYFYAHIDKIFNGDAVLDLETYATVGVKSGKTVSTNYKAMLEIYKIEN